MCILRAFENRTLKRIFGSETYEGTGERGKILNEKFHELYSRPYTIRVIR
jgi:hypothetical protein